MASDEVRQKLEQLRADYMEVVGRSFNHFYCPILYRDEDEVLCQSHIINKAFEGSSRVWTVQRKDVDNFYGSNFESDFEMLQYARSRSPAEIFMNKELHKKLDPKIVIEGRQVDYFVTKGGVPEQFARIEFEKDGQSILVGLKMSPDVLAASAEAKLEVSGDVRIGGVVSLIKAAHLTLFDMLGYRYVLSAAGEFVGRQILGEFFRQNHGKQKPNVLQNARLFFSEFATMVRPVLPRGLDLQGTITDRMFLVCWGSSGLAWAIIVFIRTGQLLHAVMLPVYDRPDVVPTFLDFLRNQNESIAVAGYCYEQGEGHCKIIKELTPLNWPKTGVGIQ
jgi:hypothetical protein